MKLFPELLLHPNIPKPLHGMNPRTILGQDWWDTHRQIAYAEKDYHCWACGIHKKEAKYHQWLEAHESYSYNYPKGEAKLDKIVALCHSCHNFIHNGKLLMDLGARKISQTKFIDILQHGVNVLNRNNLPMNPFALSIINRSGVAITDIPRETLSYSRNSKVAEWSKWHIVIDGKKYFSKFNGIDDWKSHYQSL